MPDAAPCQCSPELTSGRREVVRRGVVVGRAVRLPAGTYTVEVLSDPLGTIEDVEVEEGKDVEVTLDEDR